MSVWTAVPGQERALARLEADVAAGRVSHAYLFSGMAGGGLRDAAMAFAAALVCQNDGCGECESCRRVTKFAHPDVELVEPPGMQLLVDQVRDAVRTAWRRPTEGRRRVVVIDQADRMNPNAQNAFLKALEEPPASTVIVLVAASTEALLDTVKSRCREVTFRPLSQQQVADEVSRTGVDHQAALAYARIGGSYARALELATDDIARGRRRELAERVLRPSRDPGDALESADWLAGASRAVRDRIAETQRAEAEELADWLRETKAAAEARVRREQRRGEQDVLSSALDDVDSVLRDLLVSMLGGATELINADLQDVLSARAADLPETRIGDVMAAMEATDEARRRLRANANVLLCLEAMFLSIHEHIG